VTTGVSVRVKVIVGVKVGVRVIVGVHVGGRTTEVGLAVGSTDGPGEAASGLVVGAAEPQAVRSRQIKQSSVWNLIM
jgi:hypothetical protein